MTRKLFILLSFAPVMVFAQRVELQVTDHFVEIPVEQTQTEIRPGWKIVDIQLRSRSNRYLNGGQARHLTDDQMPQFRITPARDETLANYALIRLRQKRYYRQLPDPILRQNIYQRIEPQHFDIKLQDDSTFLCHPLKALDKGAYILVNIAQKPVGELQDYLVFPFQVP